MVRAALCAFLALPLWSCLAIVDCEESVCLAADSASQPDASNDTLSDILGDAGGSLDDAGPSALDASPDALDRDVRDEGPVPDGSRPLIDSGLVAEPDVGESMLDASRPMPDAGPVVAPGVSPMYCPGADRPGCWPGQTEMVPPLGMNGDAEALIAAGRLSILSKPQEEGRDFKFGEGGVALTRDYAVVASPQKGMERGVVHVFDLDGGGRQVGDAVALPVPVEDGPMEEYGASVAAVDDTIWVGAPKAAGDRGAVIRYIREAGRWRIDAVVLGRPDGKKFGSAVAAGPGIALVGAPHHGGGNPGSVMLFEQRDGRWGQTLIDSPEQGEEDDFGMAVAVGPEWAAVGAPKGTGIGGSSDKGAAYVFALTGESRLNLTRVWNPDDAVTSKFGRSVAISGRTLAVGGDRHRAYVYDLSRYRAGCADIVSPMMAHEKTGEAIALEGSALIVGTDHESGWIEVFRRQSGADRWRSVERIEADALSGHLEGGESDHFAEFISMSHGRALVSGRRGRRGGTRHYVALFAYPGLVCRASGECVCSGGAGRGPQCVPNNRLAVTGLSLRDRSNNGAHLCAFGRGQIVDHAALGGGSLMIRAEVSQNVQAVQFAWDRNSQGLGLLEDNMPPFDYPRPNHNQQWQLNGGRHRLVVTPRGPGANGNEAVGIECELRTQ